MKCLAQNLSAEEKFERIDRYCHNELTQKEEEKFHKHIWECKACYKRLIMHQITLKIIKERGNEIFSKDIIDQETLQRSKAKRPILQPIRNFPLELPSIINLTLLKNDIEKKIVLAGPDYSWAGSLPETNFIAIKEPGGRIIPIYGRERFLSGRSQPSLPMIQTIQISTGRPDEKAELTVLLEPKGNQVVLSLSLKMP